MTTNLTRFDNDGIELFINTQTGECFASVQGLARMVGVKHSTILRWAKSLQHTTVSPINLKGGAQTEGKMAETQAQPHLQGGAQADLEGGAQTEGKMAETQAQPHLQGVSQTNIKVPTPGGLQGATLLDEQAILIACIKYRPRLVEAFCQAGLRVYLYGLAGYQIAPTLEKADEQGQITKADLIPVIREAVGEIVREEAAKELASIHKSLDTLINGWLVKYQEGSDAFVKELEIARNTVVETCNKQLAMLEEDMQESIPLRWHKLR